MGSEYLNMKSKTFWSNLREILLFNSTAIPFKRVTSWIFEILIRPHFICSSISLLLKKKSMKNSYSFCVPFNSVMSQTKSWCPTKLSECPKSQGLVAEVLFVVNWDRCKWWLPPANVQYPRRHRTFFLCANSAVLMRNDGKAAQIPICDFPEAAQEDLGFP